MATITKRGKRWSVQIRKKGYPLSSRTFPTKAEAQIWARDQEGRIDRNEVLPNLAELRAMTLGDIIRRYLDTVTPRKRSHVTERQRLNKFLKDSICQLNLAELSRKSLVAYVDRRSLEVKPGTLRREISLIHNALDIARFDWGVGLKENPASKLRLPKLNNARERRLEKGEFPRLLEALSRTRSPYLSPFVRLALETALRRSELANLQWECIDLAARTARIPQTKTGKPRTIPLTDGAIAILLERQRDSTKGNVFPISVNAMNLAWKRVRAKAGLHDFRFHDLRHEAISRLCELGLTIPEIAVVSGHTDPRMLFRYAHLRPADLAQKLLGRSWELEFLAAEHRPVS